VFTDLARHGLSVAIIDANIPMCHCAQHYEYDGIHARLPVCIKCLASTTRLYGLGWWVLKEDEQRCNLLHLVGLTR
jgi:hypothetical protein